VATNDAQLEEMAKRTRVIVNVAGPYRLCGEAVVKAAANNGTSHVDISGEPSVSLIFINFMPLMKQRFSGLKRCNCCTMKRLKKLELTLSELAGGTLFQLIWVFHF
jgi:short subunit dehydrogenase-like uncharacterized protein